MDSLYLRQIELIESIVRIRVNFNKDSALRKTPEYIKQKLSILEEVWQEFETNHVRLAAYGEDEHEYFKKDTYDRGEDKYTTARETIMKYQSVQEETAIREDIASTSHGGIAQPSVVHEERDAEREERRTVRQDRGTEPCGKVDELMTRQRTNFRAFKRAISGINLNEISEKWEYEDELSNIQRLWNNIQSLHLEIDNILQGGDIFYEDEFFQQEKQFKSMKRLLNKKISTSLHTQRSTPVLDIPCFNGKYSQWPTFCGLFTEGIHNNNSISDTQKLQHLKVKVKGEPERLIQHLSITAENYEAAWGILVRRYNNRQQLFTTQIEILLDQPVVQRQSAFEIKRLHDTSVECIHAIHNLDIDTNTWDPLLVHLIAKKLDPLTLKEYRQARQSPRELAELNEFITFLEGKFTALEPMFKKERETTAHNSSTSRQFYQNPKPRTFPQSRNYYNYNRENYQNKTYHTQALRCQVCNWNHNLFQCKKFLGMSPDAMLKLITSAKICKNCLYKHYDKPCTSTKRCKECNLDHNTLLHGAFSKNTYSIHNIPNKSTLEISSKQPTNIEHIKSHNVNHVAGDNEEILLTTVLLNVISQDGTPITLRALLDQGSQISLISENAVQMLGLHRQQYHASVSGIGNGFKESKGIVNIECHSIYNDYKFTTQALVISRVINNLPNISFKRQVWPHLQGLKLADPDYNVSRPIDLLLDASVYSEIIMSGLMKGPPQSPIAQQTKLGYILSGNIKTFNCHVVINNLSELSKYWEIEEVSSSSKDLSEGDKYCEEFYQATKNRLSNGMYEVGLPMKPNYEENLGSSKSKATAQFYQLEQRMKKSKEFAESYGNFMEEYEKLGHMELTKGTFGTTCYLPHHGVLKLDSTTTKLRVVYNGSSKTSTGFSLNDLMEQGPNLQADLQSLIISWRQYRYVMTADIEKMFRCIFITKSYQHLQSIIWRPTPEKPLNTYHLKTVTYGTKAAPYLAIRTLKQIAQDDVDKFPLGAEALTSKFYMDDFYGGSNNLEEAKETQSQLVSILDGAGMNLRKWSSNEESLTAHLSDKQLNTPCEFKCSETRKTLGLKWIPSTDSFCYNNNLDISLHKYTKRELLSNISRIYDPIGWISPLSIKAKLLFQATWNLKISWDEKLPDEIIEKWLAIRKDFENINQIIIPRHVGNTEHTYQIHAFCDASEKSFACAIYCVTIDDKGEYISRLLVAKTKVAPLNKKVTLPRLELCGAVLLAQLVNKVINCLSQRNVNVTAWSDSMIVLGWIRGDEARWLQFVANRVKQIKAVVPAENWNYIKSEENPADSATRGLTISQLSKHRLWWEGPTWLPKFKMENLPKITYQEPDIEVKRSCINTALCHTQSTIVLELLDKFSSITFIIKTIGWVLRFIKVTKQGRTQNDSLIKTALSCTEFHQAFNLVIKTVQEYEYQEEFDNLRKLGHVHKSSKLSSLNPFIDKDDGLLKVGGRLHNSNIKWTAKHPIILSSHSRLTELIINQGHIAALHGGAKLTLSNIRDKFWIVSGIRTVKRELRKCVKCRRYSQEKYQPIMADLPAPRVNPSRPFTHCGIDFTGHFDIKTNKGRGVRTTKGYVAVFVCLATKSVHLELVSDLSTPAFLAAFRRFCSRRGVPAHMYSDNGTNFVGANKLLKKEMKEIVNNINEKFFDKIGEMSIEWHFNAPAYPSAGGLWEAAVKSLKHHLKRVIGDQRLTYEEFTTVLHQVEACLNSRPLCTVTENHEDEILTPGHFLIGGSLLSRAQTEPESLTLSKRWQLLQAINKQFWKSWSTEYLQQLQVRSKWKTSKMDAVKLNDIVLIKEENLPPGKWAMGKITELHPGNDGHVRVVTIKTKGSTIKRPVIKLVPLLPYDNEQSNISNREERKQQKRVTKGKKNAFKTFLVTLFMFLSFLISPTIPHQQGYNITAFNNNRSLYFDKMADLHVVRDDWKLIIYYDMSTYWQSLHDIQQYVVHIKESGTSAANLHYESVTLQLQHELKEIEEYNDLLVGSNNNIKRQKRGLVNGIGYIANSLFGVLDERFAEQYQKQIEITRRNENLLQHLLHNQTIIIESEFNIIKRHEEVMKKQFTFIKNHLESLNIEVNHLRIDTTNKLYITSSSLSAHLILSNIRRMQQLLIDTVTDIHQGNVNMHLISPEQLKAQMNIISSHLQGDLSLPVEGSDYKHLYKLLRVAARVTDKYLIIEVRIPLISNDKFELDKVISLPQGGKSHYHRIVPTFPYIGFNINKDSVLFLSEADLQLCRHMSSEIILCTLNSPIYSTNIKQSVCDIKIMSESTRSSQCTTEVSYCKDSWIKLHAENVWLFTCCEECHVRIICLSDVTSEVLKHSGIIELGSTCTIKGEDFTIHTHNNYFNSINIKPKIKVPEYSILNQLNFTPSIGNIPEPESEEESMWSSLRSQISELKEQSNSELNVHDVHHYSLGYIIVGILISTLVVLVYRRVRKRGVLALPVGETTTVEARDAAPGKTPQVPPAPTPRTSGGDVIVHVSSDQVRGSDKCVSRGTSPTRFVKFDIE